MKISDRLKEVASFVTPGNILCDVGTDHGYVPIYLVKNGTIPSAIAMDIGEGPLRSAYNNIKENEILDKIETRLSDGLQLLKSNEADTVLIAGMGGALTRRILEDGKEVLKTVDELVLSPHSEINLVREYLYTNGYNITKEKMVYDKGKYYTIIKAIKNDGETKINISHLHSKEVYLYGTYMNVREDKVFLQYLEYEKDKLNKILEKLNLNLTDNAERIGEIKELLALNEAALKR